MCCKPEVVSCWKYSSNVWELGVWKDVNPNVQEIRIWKNTYPNGRELVVQKKTDLNALVRLFLPLLASYLGIECLTIQLCVSRIIFLAYSSIDRLRSFYLMYFSNWPFFERRVCCVIFLFGWVFQIPTHETHMVLGL